MEVDKSQISKELICIEYPGIVKNVDKMLETLGGLQEISHVFSKDNRRLELRFRPDDIYCKPACGDRVKTNGILLKIKVSKKPNEAEKNEPQVKSIEIVGRIQTVFKFKSKCDFQYLPMVKDENGKMKSVCSSLLPSRLDGDHLKKWLDEPAEYFLPPAAFSRVDTQTLNSYMYRKNKNEDPNPVPLIGRTRKRRSGHAIFVSFNIPAIPSKPRDVALKYLKVKFLNGEPVEKVRELFKERPVWSKLALMAVSKLNHDQLKFLLPAVAYYFATGPFRVMWVRLGYDPRKDPSARIYQTLDYRIRAPAGLLSLVKAKRSYANYLLPTKSTHPSAKSVVITKELFSIQDSDAGDECTVRSDAHIFTPGVIPPARQMFYQYCDIKAPELEAMLARLPKVSVNMTCDPKNGWLPSGFDNQTRDIINMYVLEQLKKDSAAGTNINDDEEYPDDSTDEEEPWNEEFEDDEIDDIEGGN